MKTQNKRPLSSIIMSAISIIGTLIYGGFTLMMTFGLFIGIAMSFDTSTSGSLSMGANEYLNLFWAIFVMISNLFVTIAMFFVIVVEISATNVVKLFSPLIVKYLARTGYLFFIAFLFDLLAGTTLFVMNTINGNGSVGDYMYRDFSINFTLFIAGVLAFTISKVLSQGMNYKEETDTLI